MTITHKQIDHWFKEVSALSHGGMHPLFRQACEIINQQAKELEKREWKPIDDDTPKGGFLLCYDKECSCGHSAVEGGS